MYTDNHSKYPLWIKMIAKHPDMKDGKRFVELDVATKEIFVANPKADICIGNFALNFYYRPKAAMKKDWKGYKSIQTVIKVAIRELENRGFTDIWTVEEYKKMCEGCGVRPEIY